MRKALIAVIVASALFAVGAFAASFTASSEDIASGANAVQACATHVDIDFGEATVAGATTPGDYVVSSATLRFYNGTGLTAPAATGCNGFDAEVAIGTGATPAAVLTYTEYEAAAAIAGASATVNFTTPISVASIQAASVLVDGATLTADLP